MFFRIYGNNFIQNRTFMYILFSVISITLIIKRAIVSVFRLFVFQVGFNFYGCLNILSECLSKYRTGIRNTRSICGQDLCITRSVCLRIYAHRGKYKYIRVPNSVLLKNKKFTKYYNIEKQTAV